MMSPFALPDWEVRLRRGQTLMPPLPWLDGAEAGRAVAIFDKLRLPDVIGRPALAEAAGDWFREIVRALMGSQDDGGERQVREVFCLTPKKQSKTTYGAALMVTALLMNRRPRAEFLLIGPTKITADLAFDQAAGMIEADPDGFLQKRMFVQEHLKTITDRRTKAQLLIKTFDAKVLTGVKPAGVLLDELHEISKSARAARVIGQIRGGMLPIPESFLVFITTQSDERPEGAFLAELQMARDIRDGRAAGAMLPILYEFPRDIMTGSGWSDPVNWPMVMPNLGRSVTLARLEDEFATAKLKGNAELRRWASQHLNVEVGLALRSDRWAGADYWAGRVEPGLSLDRLLDRCEVVVVGVDGGGLDDLFGLTVLGRERQESDVDEGEGEVRRVHRWLSWSHAWCHEGVLDRRMSIAAVLQDFADAGELTIVDDELADLSAIVAHIEAIKDRGLLACVAVDPAGIGELVDELAAIDVTLENGMLIGVGQGYRLMGAIKTAERRLVSGALVHAPSSLMDWCVGNVKIEPTATAIRATKQNAGDAKIDPWAALINAVDRMSLNPAAIAPINIETLIA